MIVKYGHRGRWELGEYKCYTMKEAIHWMNQQVILRQEKWYYSNVNYSPEENWIEYDYGNWVLVFKLTELSDENWKEFFGKDEESKTKIKIHKLQKIGTPLSETEVGRKEKCC